MELLGRESSLNRIARARDRVADGGQDSRE
jgi:hypothetical protein